VSTLGNDANNAQRHNTLVDVEDRDVLSLAALPVGASLGLYYKSVD
jgi:hypothetical protein